MMFDCGTLNFSHHWARLRPIHLHGFWPRKRPTYISLHLTITPTHTSLSSLFSPLTLFSFSRVVHAQRRGTQEAERTRPFRAGLRRRHGAALGRRSMLRRCPEVVTTTIVRGGGAWAHPIEGRLGLEHNLRTGLLSLF
jgi:hypothetical protein